MMAYNPFYEELHHAGPPRIAFSRTELLHLVSALVVLTFAFTFVLDPRPLAKVVTTSWQVWLTSFLGMSTGFVVHELAHKVLAQRYGHWAEFRATFSFLGLTLVVAAIPPHFLFAAPGAVLIQGRVTPRENGLISLVGPGVNLAIAAVTFGAYVLGFYASGSWAVSDRDLAPFLLKGVAHVNALLAVFNLIPLGPLDGRKVLRWSGAAYAVALVLGVAMLAAVWLYHPSP
jgi:Zn-dependent protease